MAVRQYIGARYTIKVYENTLDPSSAEWQSGVTYEPLTLVTYNNSSYLSKTQVGAGVGNPAANPAYWVVTGYYNGQILTLQNQIDAINSDLVRIPKNLSGRKFIFLGDSYSIGQQGSQGTTNNGWVDQVISALGLNSSQYYRCTAADIGGYPAFYPTTGAHKSWADSIQTMRSHVPDDIAPLITDVVLAGGYNEYFSPTQTVYDIEFGMQAYVNYCKQQFPNATLWLGFIGYNVAPTAAGADVRRFLNTTVYPTYKTASKFGFRVMDGVEHCLWYKNDADDQVHPTTQIYKLIGYGIANNLLGSSYDPAFEHGNVSVEVFNNADFTGDDSIGAVNFIGFSNRIHNDHLTLSITANAAFTNVPLPTGGGSVTLGTIDTILPINREIVLYAGVVAVYGASILTQYNCVITLKPDCTLTLTNLGVVGTTNIPVGTRCAFTPCCWTDIYLDHTNI